MKTAINAVVRVANVEVATQLAGYSKGVYEFKGGRILVIKSPFVIEGEKGNWSFIHRFTSQLFEGEQLEYFLGWCSWARKSLTSGLFSPGQALVLAGEHGCGKNAVLDLIVTEILGGRSAKPYQYMTAQTTFNSEMFKAEHLIISDEIPATRYEERIAFGSQIKQICVERTQRLHPKGRDAIMLQPFWRLSIALNDDEDSLNILPPLADAILEKLMLFRVKAPDCLPDKDSETSQKKFAEKIRRELPAFIYYLENEHEIRPETSPR